MSKVYAGGQMGVVEGLQYRSRVAVAGLVALAVTVILFVQDLIGTASSMVVGFSLDDVQSGYYGYVWQSLGYGLIILLSFALGVFASLWLLARVSAALTVTQVVLRGLLAAAIGAVLVLAVSFAFGMIGPMSGAGPMFGNSFPWPSLQGTVQAATMALQTAIGAFVQQAPIAILVVVLTWLWLQKHPSFGTVASTQSTAAETS